MRYRTSTFNASHISKPRRRKRPTPENAWCPTPWQDDMSGHAVTELNVDADMRLGTCGACHQGVAYTGDYWTHYVIVEWL